MTKITYSLFKQEKVLYDSVFTSIKLVYKISFTELTPTDRVTLGIPTTKVNPNYSEKETQDAIELSRLTDSAKPKDKDLEDNPQRIPMTTLDTTEVVYVDTNIPPVTVAKEVNKFVLERGLQIVKNYQNKLRAETKTEVTI